MKGALFMAERLKWSEIQQKYPDMWVGMVDVKWLDTANIDSAIVEHTENDMSEDDMDMLAIEGKLIVRYTTPNKTPSIGTLLV